MAKPKVTVVKTNKPSKKNESINYFKYLNNVEDDLQINKINDNLIEEELLNSSKDNDVLSKFYKNEKIAKFMAEEFNNDNEDDENLNNFDSDGWKSVEKKKPNGKNKLPSFKQRIKRMPFDDKFEDDHNIFEKNSDIEQDFNDDGSEYKLENSWYIWTHLSESSNWTPESYKHIFTIDSLKTFWEFFGNIDKLDIIKHQFYIMRSNSCPTWEHPSNRNGGICSIRVIKDRAIEIIEQIAILVLNECFSDIPSDINGLSFSVKHNWGVIKIWNKTGSNDISTQIPMYMLKRYSATPKFNQNKPEY